MRDLASRSPERGDGTFEPLASIFWGLAYSDDVIGSLGSLPRSGLISLTHFHRQDIRCPHLVDAIGPELHQFDALRQTIIAVVNRAGRGIETVLLHLNQFRLEAATAA
jgi:hypothetical protein